MGFPIKRGERLVVKIGSASNVVTAEFCQKLTSLFQALALNLVVVHGGSEDIDQRLKDKGIPTEKRDGLRVTTPVILEVVLNSLSQRNQLITAFMGECGCGVPILGQDIAQGRRYRPELGLGLVGDVELVDTSILERYFNQGKIPVISTACRNAQEQIYNVNADVFAKDIAAAIKARRLIFTTNKPGIMPNGANSWDSPIPSLNLENGWILLEDKNVISDGMYPKLKSALWALERGVPEVHICQIAPESLEAIAKGEVPGTILTAN